MKSAQKGFTLVEIAIVLVIIGLLLGQLMTHKYLEEFRQLQPGDILGIETLYGSPRLAPGMRPGDVREAQLQQR